MLPKKRGFENAVNKMYPKPKCNTCTLDAPNALVIAPDGQCYKCISQIGEQRFSIGKIDDKGIEYKEYKRYSPFQMKQCRECVYLPICKGGCLYNTCTGTYLSCDVWKYVTEKIVLEVAKEHACPDIKNIIEGAVAHRFSRKFSSHFQNQAYNQTI